MFSEILVHMSYSKIRVEIKFCHVYNSRYRHTTPSPTSGRDVEYLLVPRQLISKSAMSIEYMQFWLDACVFQELIFRFIMVDNSAHAMRL